MGKPDYAKWIRKPLWFLVDAAQLLADSEPIRPPLAFVSACNQGKAGRACDIYSDLKNAITLNALGFHESRTNSLGTRLVKPVECVIWAQEQGMEVPEPLRVLTESSKSSHKPDWKHWNACDLLEVWEAVALSLDREPKSIQDNRTRLTGPMREIKLFDGGPDFDRRLDLLRRAFDLQASQFTPADDIYGGFDLFEERNVLPAKVRQFFVNKGFAVPPEWTAIESTPASANVHTESDASQPWVALARQIGQEVLRENPRLNLDQVAKKVHERLKAEGARGRGRGDKVPSAGTIRRHALKGLKSS